ncbi:SDR family NAD(P)-dependent oxidoreductase [Shewanella sp. SR44-3]|uniref:SDR family NAD(P)-dependent oxidoreductase n=1 Tax=unclassified Shewanella TaxID=196818 RepID=UPI0015F90BA1|nr:SDR family NAD(P)-dependent oxidoreductase [Shewanella sp. SR44-3]MBB1269317.1 SDR family NAD(P)-dependent oxidoreductase [Shewanella sp. SR44-3]
MRIMITGATSGIGKALTLAYAQAGHQVIACGRNEQKLIELSAMAVGIEYLCFDLTDFDSYPALTLAQGQLDLLILNAGDCEYIDDALAFDAKRFEKIININLVSVGYCLQAWLANIKPTGRLVLISSSAQYLPLSRAEAYGASKAALTYLGRTLAIDLAKHNISVTVVHPGFVDTPLTKRNRFTMPMIITSEQAATNIILGLEKGQSEIAFPKLFIFIIRSLAVLPQGLWRRLALRMSS